jgi:predicted RNase H-like HicB family nuclease
MNKRERQNGDELRPEYKRADFGEMIRGKYASRIPVQRLTLSLECGEQADGRWLARIVDLPDLVALGDSCESAIDGVETLAAATIAARVQRGELPPTGLNFAITTIHATPRHTPN